ncbi:MAG: hypothetical protein AB7S70_12880 [Hyphomicrobium sp.]|uniref:hypothetical protein n=1 Tax=Hyphomicrobium sp. TaxID=82 RepID=UPI003D0ADEB3
MGSATEHSVADAPGRGAAMPRPLKLGVTVVAVMIISGAIGLFALRGAALLIDLSQLSGLGFCF